MSETDSFFDIPSLLTSSQPRSRSNWLVYSAGVFILLVLSTNLAGDRLPGGAQTMQLLSSVFMLGIIGFMGAMTWRAVREVRGEQKQLEAAEELLQLRRWPEAAVVIRALLSRPTRTPQTRILSLLFLVKLLGRYDRFADVASLCDHLLSMDVLDSDTSHTLRVERAMAMVHDDRLFDVDRSIAELRRSAQAPHSAGLALVEIYRDVKTGHAQEALAVYEEKLPLLRRHLAHRVADAHALAARGYDMLGKTDQATRAYADATTLASEAELQRRYPEVKALSPRFSPAPAPAEAI